MRDNLKSIWARRRRRTTRQLDSAHVSKDTMLPLRHQLRWHLILSFVALAVLPLTLVVTVTLSQTRAQAREQVVNQLESIAVLKGDQIMRWLQDSKSVLDLPLSNPLQNARITSFVETTTQQIVDSWLSDLETPVDFERDSLNNLLGGATTAQPFFKELFLYNADGHIVAASDVVEIVKTVASQPYFSHSLAAEYVQPPYYLVGSNELAMFVTHPLIDQQSGQTVGVLAGRLDMTVLGQIMTERTGLDESGETYLVSQESNFLVTPSRFEDEGYIPTRAYHSEGIDRALLGEDGSGTYASYQDPPVAVIGVYRWIPELEVGMLAEVNEAQALAPFVQVYNFSIGLAALAALLAVAVGLVTATRIARPITALTRVATRISEGDLEQRAEISQHNEIGLLANAFNLMLVRLREMLANEQQQREHLQSTIATYVEHMTHVAQGDLS